MARFDDDEERDIAVLIQTALIERLRMNKTKSDGASVADVIADQLGYDRSLIRLCLACGIETDPTRFERPAIQRDRLEVALARIGVDFETVSRKIEDC